MWALSYVETLKMLVLFLGKWQGSDPQNGAGSGLSSSWIYPHTTTSSHITLARGCVSHSSMLSCIFQVPSVLFIAMPSYQSHPVSKIHYSTEELELLLWLLILLFDQLSRIPVSSCLPVCCRDVENFRGLARGREGISMACLICLCFAAPIIGSPLRSRWSVLVVFCWSSELAAITVGMGRVQEIQRGFEAIFALPWAAPSIKNEAQYLPKEVQVDKNVILVI